MTTRTRALVYDGPGTPLREAELDLAAPRRGEVLVRLRASGVCHSDLHAFDGDWVTETPIVLGHEGAGVVEAVGEGVVDVEPGDHVVLSWIAPCRRCRACVSGQAWACVDNHSNDNALPDGTKRLSDAGRDVGQYIGLGTFSEHVVVAESAVVAIPDEVPFDVACLLGCAVATGVGAVFNNARVTPGSSVAVVGCGGVGLSIVLGARAAGAFPIIAIDVEPAKLELALTAGASHVVLSERGSDVAGLVRAIVPAGVEYGFDAAGTVPTMQIAIDVLGIGGAAVLVGMPPDGTILPLDPLALSSYGQRVIGSNYGGIVPSIDFARLATLYLAGRLPVDQLISHRIDLSEVGSALDAIRGRERARSVVLYP